MSQPIKFFEKNLIDIDLENVTIVVTDAVATNDGQDFVGFLRNRNNESAWATTGSSDAALTQLDIDMSDQATIDRLLLVGHTFKAFTIQYWDGFNYVDFSTAIAETVNTQATNEFQFDEVITSKIRIIISETQVANTDKIMKQLLIVKSLGQLQGWPEVKKPIISLSKKAIKLLSGKKFLNRQRGFFAATLTVSNYNLTADVDIIERIYFRLEGTLIWINAGDSAQFSRTHIGYRPEDIFLVKPQDEWSPAFVESLYQAGIKLKMALVEVVR